jgi:hypothetical protein
MRLTLIVSAALAALALSTSAANAADVFGYQFDNNPADEGTVDGSVFGQIFFGQEVDNGVFYATNVTVTRHPHIDGVPDGAFNVPDYAALQGLFINQDIFEVIGGNIVWGEYQIWGGSFDLNIPCCGRQYNTLGSAFGRVQNWEGIGPAPGLRFTAAPEPAAWALMVGGFGALGAMLRGRRRLALA